LHNPENRRGVTEDQIDLGDTRASSQPTRTIDTTTTTNLKRMHKKSCKNKNTQK